MPVTLRLDGARQVLCSEAASNIASVAMRWGFAHLRRFSMQDKERFGANPSQSTQRHQLADPKAAIRCTLAPPASSLQHDRHKADSRCRRP